MKFVKRTLSVALSLVLCGAMILPSFAASFGQLQNAIDSGYSVYQEGKDENSEGTGAEKYKIEVTDDPNGRNVKLWDTVTYDADAQSTTEPKTITVSSNVTLDLNGNTIDGTGSNDSVIRVTNGGNLTLNDTSENETGTVKGGQAQWGGGVDVSGGSTFILKKGTISGNSAYANSGAAYGGGVSVRGNSSFIMDGGKIQGNTANPGGNSSGGGVYVNGSSFTMNGGKILDNKASNGGGIFLDVASSFSMQNGTVSKNSAVKGSGGGIAINTKNAEISISDSVISNNTAEHPDDWGGYGGGISGNGKLQIKGSRIEGNTANHGGGISTTEKADIQDTEILRNTAKYNGGGIYNGGQLTMVSGSISENTAEELGGGVFSANHFEVQSGTITKNKATTGGGIYNQYVEIWCPGELEVSSDAEVHDNEATSAGDDIYAPQGATLILGGSSWRLDNEDERNANKAYESSGDNKAVENVGLKAGTVVPPAVGPGTGDDLTAGDPADEGGEPDDPTIEIDEPAIPLASGPITRAQFIDYLWRHEGEPETDGPCTFTDVPEDHEYVLALAWAEQNEVASAYEDGTFLPDELVTVADVRAFLGGFEKAFGTNAVAVDELTTLTGGDGEAVIDCAQVLAEFFGEEHAVPGDSELEIDPAA